LRVAVVFGVFSDTNKRTPAPFVRANTLSVITVANPHCAVTMNLRSVIPQDNGDIHIGAVGYPYTPEKHDLSIKEVRATKSGKVNFKSSSKSASGVPVEFDFNSKKWLDINGKEHHASGVKPVEVRYNFKEKRYLDSAGVAYPYEFVRFRFYNSFVLDNHRRALEAGQTSNQDQPYINWMEEIEAKKGGHVLDEGVPIGRAMSDILRQLYINRELALTSQIEMPEFFVSSVTPIEYDNDVLDQDILTIARSPGNRLACERPPFEGFIQGATHDGESMLVDFQRVSRATTPKGHIFKVTDAPQTIVIPDPNQVVSVNGEPIDLAVGTEVHPSRVVNPLKAVMRLIPYDPSYASIREVEERCGKALIHYVRQQLVEQSTPVIQGIKSVALRYVKKLPPDYNPNNVWARTGHSQYIYEMPVGAFTGQIGRIKYDFLHHPWFDRSASYYSKREPVGLRPGTPVRVVDKQANPGVPQNA